MLMLKLVMRSFSVLSSLCIVSVFGLTLVKYSHPYVHGFCSFKLFFIGPKELIKALFNNHTLH